MRILFLGDVVGRSGRTAIKERLKPLRERLRADFVIVNGENATSGAGLSEDHAKALLESGADVLTLGDHAFDQKDMLSHIEREPRIIRPVNYAKQAPGVGSRVFEAPGGRKVLVAQVLGQVFMKRAFDDPFSAVDNILRTHPLGGMVQAIVVDVHCEATSEKMGMGHYCDGRASMVVGSHTHVPTADAQILPGGTAFQADAGMCGDYNSVIGMDKAEPLRRFVTGMGKGRFEPASGEATLSGLFVVTDDRTGKATQVHMIRDGGRLQASGPDVSERLFLILVLAVMGAGWGATQPLAKIAVSEGYRHIGLVFWQLAIGALVMGVIQTLRGRRLTISAPAMRVYVLIAMIGTILPNSASYEAARHLPAGVVSILLSLVPLFAFPFAILMGNEKFQWLRFGGLALGLFGVLLIVAPEASLPERAAIVFIPLALIAPMFYGLEGNVVAKWGTAGLEPVEVLYGASVVGAVIALPVALASGQFIDPRGPWGAPDYALMISSVIHVLVYSAYVWMVGRAGPVFAVQVSYLVTGFGVGWAMLILGESYSVWVWGAMAVILTGVFLVQPSPREALVELDERGKS